MDKAKFSFTHFFDLMILFIKVDMTYAACVAYIVDVMQSRSSEILAAIKFVIFFFDQCF